MGSRGRQKTVLERPSGGEFDEKFCTKIGEKCLKKAKAIIVAELAIKASAIKHF